MANTQAALGDRRAMVDDALLRGCDAALASVIFVAPLFMGGRHPVGELVYVALVSLTASLWCLHQMLSRQGRWRMSGVELLLLGSLVLLATQLIELPTGTLSSIAPLASDLLPLWGDGPVRLGQWTTISLTPADTRGQLVILTAHIMLFVIVVQRIQSTDDVQRLLRWISMAVIGMAMLALLQLFAGNGKFLWVYEDVSRTTDRAAKGTFVNENHLASFLALGFGPIVAWIASFGTAVDSGGPKSKARSRQKNAWNHSTPQDAAQWQPLALYVGLGIVAFAGLLTFSRGGVLVVATASVATTILLVWSGVLGRRAMGGLAVAMLIVGGALFIFGYRSLASEMESLGSGSLEELDHNSIRTRLWAADLQATSRSPWLGTGAGSHAEVYPTFFADAPNREYTHAESGYIQLVMETGAIGLSIGVTLLVTCLVWAGLAYRRGGREPAGVCAAVVLAGLIASAGHSIADFVWFIPACMSFTIILAACACRLWQLTRPEPVAAARVSLLGEYAVSGFTWSIATIVVAGLSVLLIANRTGPALASSSWVNFLKLRRSEVALGEEADVNVLMRYLDETLSHQPDHPRANLRMAAVCLRQFEQQQLTSEIPMPLSQIREAVKVSGFTNKAEQDAWVNRITGDNRKWLDRALYHIHQALALCPLQGEAYAMLADVAFLHGPRAPADKVLVEQALVVRPYDAHVQFAAGREAAIAGDDQLMIQRWRKAFHSDKKYRSQIIATLAPRVSAEEFVAEFNPDRIELRDLFLFCRDAQLEESATVVARLLASDTEQRAAEAVGTKAGTLWRDAYYYYVQIGDEQRALYCIGNAAKADSLNYDYHLILAGQLLKANQYDDAIVEIRWCRQRRTADARVERLWAVARRGPRIEEPSLR